MNIIPIRPFISLLRCLFFLAVASLPVSAISVDTPTFTDLVERSEEIVQATVADIQSKWVTSAKGDRVIKTFVRLRIKETAKGPSRDEVTLTFFGGTLDGKTMVIAGMPQFRKGQRGWFFIKGNGCLLYTSPSPRDRG